MRFHLRNWQSLSFSFPAICSHAQSIMQSKVELCSGPCGLFTQKGRRPSNVMLGFHPINEVFVDVTEIDFSPWRRQRDIHVQPV